MISGSTLNVTIVNVDVFNVAFFMAFISAVSFPVFLASLLILGKKQQKTDLAALLVTTVSFSIFFQYFFSHPRPAGALLKNPDSPYSFPSTHSSSAFAWAEFMSLKFEGYKTVFYVFAALVAVSRVYIGVHYPVDVVAGALLGWFIAKIVTRAEHER